MKKILIIATIILSFGITNAQNATNLIGKSFEQIDNIPNSTTTLFFKSNTIVIYVITNIINGKTIIDECPGKCTIIGNKISIKCSCSDKEIYPDPITDNFIYDTKYQTLTSSSYRSRDGKFLLWKLI
jgi:hypothetical protein